MSLLNTHVGKIRIIEPLGAGGNADVYLGLDESLNRKVAVKVRRGKQRIHASAKARFHREAQILSQIEHPNLCRVYDYLECGDCDFLILEYIRGKTLDEFITPDTRFEVRLKIALQTGRVLQATHAKDIVHRDLKPNNIMIADDHVVKVLDFGLARPLVETEALGDLEDEISSTETSSGQDDSHTSPIAFRTERGKVTGTPMFMSPEQALGEEASSASDMYSFGLILQWLFSGRYPYQEGLPLSKLLPLVIKGATAQIEDINPDLKELIQRLKSLSPNLRPTAVETANQLSWILEIPRRRTRRLVIWAFMILLFLGTALSTWGFIKATRAEHDAKESEAAALMAKHDAEQAHGQSEAVNAFLQDMITAADPEGQGIEVKVVDILDHAAANLTQEFSDHPLNRAAIHHALGTTYYGLGKYPQARDQLDQARHLRNDLLGEEHVDTINSVNALASTFTKLGELPEAESLYRKNLAVQTRNLDASDPDVLRTQGNLAIVFKKQGKFADAERLYRQVLDQKRKILAEDDLSILRNMDGLAGLLTRQGKTDAASRLFEEVVELKHKKLGEEHPSTIVSMYNQAVCLEELGKFGEAEPGFQRTHELACKVFGEEHSTTMAALMGLAKIKENLEAYDEAEPLYQKAFEIQTRALGPDHPNTQVAKAGLAQIASCRGQYLEAITLYEETRASFRTSLGDEHYLTLATMTNLGGLYLKIQEFDKADLVLSQALEAQRRVLGSEHPTTLYTAYERAALLLERGERDIALALHEQVLATRRQVLGDSHQDTLTSKNAVASIRELMANQPSLERP